jgi:hypothetical protein
MEGPSDSRLDDPFESGGSIDDRVFPRASFFARVYVGA